MSSYTISYSGDFSMDNMQIILIGVTLILIILFVTGIISFPKTEARLQYKKYINKDKNFNNVQDLKQLNRIRHDDGSVLDSEMSRPAGNNQVYTRRGPIRRPSYPNINIPENPITDSSIIIPPIPNSTREMRAQPMMPEFPRLSSRYTNQKFGAFSTNNYHPSMNSKVNTTSVEAFTPEISNRKSSRKSPY
jgi:hypothetical protein